MIVAVTGLMRSGTSALAKIVHDLGIQMGTTMLFPATGIQPEYEDADLTVPLFAAVEEDRNFPRIVMDAYVQSRNRVHGETWGVKSPFLLPHLKCFRKVAGDSSIVLMTRRPVSECEESLDRISGSHGNRERLARVQHRLRKAWNVGLADHVVDEKDLRHNHDAVVERVRGWLS